MYFIRLILVFVLSGSGCIQGDDYLCDSDVLHDLDEEQEEEEIHRNEDEEVDTTTEGDMPVPNRIQELEVYDYECLEYNEFNTCMYVKDDEEYFHSMKREDLSKFSSILTHILQAQGEEVSACMKNIHILQVDFSELPDWCGDAGSCYFRFHPLDHDWSARPGHTLIVVPIGSYCGPCGTSQDQLLAHELLHAALVCTEDTDYRVDNIGHQHPYWDNVTDWTNEIKMAL